MTMREENIILLLIRSSQTTSVFINSLEEDTLGKFALNSTLKISILISHYFITSCSSYIVTAHSFIRMTKVRLSIFTYASLPRSHNSTEKKKQKHVG